MKAICVCRMFMAAKDAMASRAAQMYIDGRIARYGKLQRLKIDSQNGTMEAACLLHGEREPITVHVDNYTVLTEGSRRLLRISGCRCSRPWLQNLLEDYLEGKKVELPGWAAAALQ